MKMELDVQGTMERIAADGLESVQSQHANDSNWMRYTRACHDAMMAWRAGDRRTATARAMKAALFAARFARTQIVEVDDGTP